MNKWQKLLGGAAAMAMVLATIPASAQTPVKFTLDWVFQGPTSPFLVALEKGYYKAEGLDVTMDPGQGSAGAVQRVATGAYQIGFADVNATIEYNAKNPGKEVLCVFMAYDFAPFGVYALKKSGIKTPKDLDGKKLALHSEGAVSTAMVKNWVNTKCPGTKPNYVIIAGSDNRLAAMLANQIEASPVELGDAVTLDLNDLLGDF